MSEINRTNDEKSSNYEIKERGHPATGMQVVNPETQDTYTADHQNKSQEPKNVSRLATFKKWLTTITVAEVFMVVFTAIIAWATITYTEYAKGQWSVMRDQLEEIRKGARDTKTLIHIAKKQAENTEKLAGAAETANKLAKANVTVANRPWVGPSQITITNVEVGKAPSVKFAFWNFGKSPALRVVYQVHVILGTENITDLWSELIAVSTKKILVSTIFPSQGTEGDAPLKKVLSNDVLADIKEGRIKIIGFGKITYYDTDGGEHHTWIYSPYNPDNKSMSNIRDPRLPADD